MRRQGRRKLGGQKEPETASEGDSAGGNGTATNGSSQSVSREPFNGTQFMPHCVVCCLNPTCEDINELCEKT